MKDTKKIEQVASLEELFERLIASLADWKERSFLLKILLIYIRKAWNL